MRTLDQIRAARAYSVAARLDSETAGAAVGLPMTLLQNGLLATFAFLLKKTERLVLAEAMLSHFRELEEFSGLVPEREAKRVFRNWVDGRHALTGTQLRRLSGEALALAGWLKRACEAETDTEVGG